MFHTDTSIQKLNIPGIQPFYLRRDDLIHPFVSGNKWRKLEGIVHVLQANGLKRMATFGGAFSNHLLATACAGALIGFATRGIVRGEPVNNHVLLLCRQFGMELEFWPRERFREERRSRQKLEIENDTLWVPEGGACSEALEGCGNIAGSEEWDEIWVAVGTATTLRGIGKSVGAEKCHGVMAVNDAELAGQLREEGFRIYEEYHLGAYARWDDHLIGEAKRFSSSTGILLDPVYTAKLWWAFSSERKENGRVNPKILLVHTGGLTGWLSERMITGK